MKKKIVVENSNIYSFIYFLPLFLRDSGLLFYFLLPPSATTTTLPDDNTVIPHIRTIEILSLRVGGFFSIIIKSDFARPWLESQTGI